MKKHLISLSSLLVALNTMPVFALSVSGTVSDSTDVLIGANIRAIDSSGKMVAGTATDLDGHFNINIPDGTKLQVSYAGHKTKIIEKPGQNLNIKLEDTPTLSEVEVKECNLKKYHASAGHWDTTKDTCVIEDCELKYELKNNKCVEIICDETEGYEFNGNTNQCDKTECSISEKEAILNANGIGPKWDGKQCIPTGCDDAWNLKNNKCIHDKCTKPEEDWDENQQKCVQVRCSNEQISAANATSKSKWINGHCEFVCDEKGGFTLNGDKCVQTSCTEKDAKQMQKNNVSKYELQDGKCIALECVSNEYELSQEQNACINKKCQTPEEDVVDGECKKVKCTTQEEEAIHAKESTWDGEKCVATKCDDKVYNLDNGVCKIKDERSDDEKKNALEEKRKAYEEAKKKEQSFENRALTAVTTAATGIGGMQLMQGLAEQSSDKAAEEDMTAYIETMRCTYGEDKQVKAGTEEIELPGANDEQLMNLRAEYLALAADLKERKEALGMKPGIESEEILDRASSGLYDEETIGISNGAYASRYRAQMLQSEADQAKIDDAASTSKNRVTGGAIAAGAGVVVGIAGNSLINGKLGEMIKNKKGNKNIGKEEKALWEKEDKALEDLKKCLKTAEIAETDSLDFDNFYPSILSVKNINCKNIQLKNNKKASDVKATEIFADSDNENTIFDSMNTYFDMTTINKLLGLSNQSSASAAKEKIKSSMASVQKRFNDAKEKDKKTNSNSSEKSGGLGNILDNVDVTSFLGKDN